MSKREFWFKLVNIIIDAAFVVFMIIHLCMNVEYNASIASMAMVFSGGIKLIHFLLSGEYKNRLKQHEAIVNPLLIVLGFIYMIVRADASVVCITYGIIDIIDGILGVVFRSLQLKGHKLALVEVALSIGDIVFGTLLVIEGLHGLRVHLIFLTITVGMYILIEVLEPYIDKSHE